MNLTFQDKKSFFSLASTASYERSLDEQEKDVLGKIYDTCNSQEQEDMWVLSYSLCEMIKDRKQDRENNG